MMRGITKKIGSIKFSCVSPEEIRKMSATKIITADTYDDEGYPIEMGLMDPHMGVIEPGLRCKTCGCKVDECPGHFGHIDLAMPVIHVGFIKDIKMMLESTCRSCGRLMLTADQIAVRMNDMDEMKELGGGTIDVKNFSKDTAKDASTKGVCPYCGAEQIKIKLDKPTTFREVDDNHKLTPKEVRERLERITDDDLKTLGMDPATCRPEWMVLTALAVPPVTVRPSITLDSGDRSEDDLTHKLVDVLRINQRLRENRDAGAPQLIVEDLWELLQYHVTTYFDNQTSGIPPARHRSGRPLKTLAQRLKGKEGRFRSNLSGKRVNFSARTVISPDPLLSINDVGVPIAAARELTVPVHVHEHNIEKIKEMVARGPESKEGEPYLPGVNYVIRSDGRRIRVTARNAEEVAENLELDYTVERQLVDGDVVLFNRQPSLHRMSMMAHRVKIMEGRTFRFNLCDCPPYNADFDGDEMNLHVLQSDEARAEARILMQVQENILSPRYGGPIIGAIHDHITGAYFLTHNNPHFDRFEAMNILSKLPDIEIPEPFKDEKGEEYWTGRQLFSIVLPGDFRTTFKANICQNCNVCKKENCEFDSYVKIREGQLLCGTIDVKGIGNSKGKILDRIARDYGSDRACQFLNQVTRLALGALMNHGFSTGIGDEDIPEEAQLQIANFNQECINKVSQLVESFQDGTLDQMPGRSLRETLEVEVMKVLGQARDEAGRVAGKHLGMSNPAVIMAKAGARGSMLNLSQMAGCVGQQAVRGERLSRGYWNRTLPHFHKGDLGAYARGFCSNSYKSGLTPTEFFFHAMGGREGLVDTAVRTSRSGYMQRRLVSALEDLKLTSDGTVRNTIGTVIQFKYGEDGVDPSRTVRGKAIDLDDLFAEIFGDEADHMLKIDDHDVGDDYGAREKDEMEYTEEDGGEGEAGEFEDLDTDFESGGE
ncbi:MAG: DNA-directed RNA polymerase subunit A' [Candidatus Methanomethylophilaceae archaeon]|nr:DNA-directed RNA polymerase subunit A' [Candidatus Methanomethylophilaceae archaeon]MDD3378882.1 DNA-directed RNA polymerase subunit A' [Candidatus Methanomethylophilaceae archaeon]MDY0223987.1 DNA-directed RNA polymerase subunit A' [Candidatus Methanomethylophilaceae archaeon]